MLHVKSLVHVIFLLKSSYNMRYHVTVKQVHTGMHETLFLRCRMIINIVYFIGIRHHKCHPAALRPNKNRFYAALSPLSCSSVFCHLIIPCHSQCAGNYDECCRLTRMRGWVGIQAHVLVSD